MTIDQMLIYIPQLTARKSKLSRMRSRLPKERVQSGISRMNGVVEYEYCNYDLKQAEAEYEFVADELARAQNALDMVNSTATFEAEVDWESFREYPIAALVMERAMGYSENLDKEEWKRQHLGGVCVECSRYRFLLFCC